MPLKDDTKLQNDYFMALGRTLEEQAIEQEKTPFWETVTAHTINDNSLVAPFFRHPDSPDKILNKTNFNIFDHLTDDEKLDKAFISRAVFSENLDELNSVRFDTSEERHRREKVAKGGLLPVLMAEAFDLINIFPVAGTAYKTYKTGGSILKGALVTSATATSAVAAEEALLQHTQITRSYGESAANLGTTAFLAGVFGGAPIAFRNMVSKSGHDYDKVIADVADSLDPEPKVAAGQNSVLSPEVNKSMGAAQVQDIGDVQIRGKVARAFVKSIRLMGPLTRGLTSNNAAMRKNTARLSESPLDMESTLAAPKPVTDAKPLGDETLEEANKRVNEMNLKAFEAEKAAFDANLSYDSIESNITSRESLLHGALMNHKKEMTRYFESQADGSNYKGFKGLVRSGLNRREFNEAVAKAVRSGKSDNEFVQKAADMWRKDLYEPLLEEGKSLGLIDEAVETLTANNYLNRIWNVQEITNRLPEFEKTVKSWLVNKHADALGDALPRIMKAMGDDVEIERILDEIEGLTDHARREITNMDDLADEISSKIISSPDGRIPYDYQIGENKFGVTTVEGGGSGSGLRGAFNKRTFLIPDDLVEDFLINDIEELAYRYSKGVIADIEITKGLGDVEGTLALKDIQREGKKLMKAAPSEWKRARAKNKMRQDLTDFKGMIARIRGTNVVPASTPIGLMTNRVFSAAKNLNVLRFMGGVMPSSVMDVGRVVMAEGYFNMAKHALIPMVKDFKKFKMAADDARPYMQGMQVLMGERANILADVSYMAQDITKFEKGLASAAKGYSKINLLTQWTAGMKTLHGVTAQSRIADELTKGVFNKRLKQLGMSDNDLPAIAEQIKKYGKKEGELWIINAGKWDRGDLAKKWMAGMRKESNRVIITPGQEKSFLMDTMAGSVLMQFKSFMMASTVRFTASVLQKQDEHLIQGLSTVIGLGMLSYVFKEWDAGREISDDPRVWIMEGIDRSGALGIITEIDNTLTKLTSDSHGIRPYLGIDGHASRFASRSAFESLLGPTYGLGMDALKHMANIGTDKEHGGRQWDDSDTRAFRRLLPYQNLMILRQGFDKIEESVGD